MSWTTVTLPTGSGVVLSLGLPPGWWRMPTDDPDLPARSREIVERQSPGLGREVADELARLAQVAAFAGAVLLAGGTAADPETGQTVSASLLLARYPEGGVERAPAVREGPTAHLHLTAGPTVRRTFLGTAASPLGDLLDLECEYVVTPPASPPWLLSFRTPALRHVGDLVLAFDAIADTFAVVAPPVAAAFS